MLAGRDPGVFNSKGNNMNLAEPTYIKRPILSTDCLALARIARLAGDDTVTPTELRWWIKQRRVSGILYEHEIDGAAHPIAWCVYQRNKHERAIMVDIMYCHLEYDAVMLYQLMTGHIMRLTTPRYPLVIFEGVESTDEDLIQALHGLGFWNVASTVCGSQSWLEFRYGRQE